MSLGRKGPKYLFGKAIWECHKVWTAKGLATSVKITHKLWARASGKTFSVKCRISTCFDRSFFLNRFLCSWWGQNEWNESDAYDGGCLFAVCLGVAMFNLITSVLEDCSAWTRWLSDSNDSVFHEHRIKHCICFFHFRDVISATDSDRNGKKCNSLNHIIITGFPAPWISMTFPVLHDYRIF